MFVVTLVVWRTCPELLQKPGFGGILSGDLKLRFDGGWWWWWWCAATFEDIPTVVPEPLLRLQPRARFDLDEANLLVRLNETF